MNYTGLKSVISLTDSRVEPARMKRHGPDFQRTRKQLKSKYEREFMITSIPIADSSLSPARAKRVLIVDDHALVRKGLTLLVDEEIDLQVCGEASDPASALDAVIRLRPDVILADWSLGLNDASDFITLARTACPSSVIVVVSMHDEVDYVERVARLGARGYVMKRDAPDRMIEGIRRTASGLHAFTDRALRALPDDLQTSVQVTQPNPESAPRSWPGSNVKADMVIAPHPDDETFGCGGTIGLVSESGTPVDVLFMTRGEQGHDRGADYPVTEQESLAAVRQEEATSACRILGVRQVTFLSGSDTQLAQQPHLAEDLLTLFKQGSFRRIFCPWKHDAHPDHQATFTILQLALRHYDGPMQIWLYEVWTPLPFNVVVPIDRTILQKKKAIEMYQSQLKQLNYRGGFMGLSAYRSTVCPPAIYAEAFLMCTKEEFLAM